MATILFDIFPATGHYHATFKLAKLLKERGHLIVYIGAAEFSGKVTARGFEYYSINPFIFRQDKAVVIQKGWMFYFLESLMDLFTEKRSEELLVSSKEYDKLLKKYSPDLIILDYQYVLKAVFYYIYNIKVISVLTKVATNRSTWIPPFQYTLIPQRKFRYKLLLRWLWFTHIIKKKTRIFFYKIFSLGQDNLSLFQKIALENGFPFQQNIDFQRTFGIGFKNIVELIISPKDFDFPRPPAPNQFYIGPLIDINREGTISDNRYLEITKQIAKEKNEGKSTKLIYCSLGTVTKEHLKYCEAFYKKMLAVCSQNPQYKIILSVGKYYNINKLFPIPANLYVFQQVPQIDLLTRCDLMITHGGMNTITECVFAGVPMLVFPLSPHWDQPGNAARVVYHGLGLKGDIKQDGAKRISGNIKSLIENYGAYKENVRKMKVKFDEMNNSKEAVNIIEGLIKDSNFKLIVRCRK